MRCAFFALTLLAMPAQADIFESSAGPLLVEPVVEGLDQPWAFAFLPDFGETGAMLITEKPGALRLFANGQLSDPLPGGPESVDIGQGGLLDVALAKDFESSGEIYLTYAARDGDLYRTEIARAKLLREPSPRLEGLEVIYRQVPSLRGWRHFGSRIAVADDGTLFVSLGERGHPDEVQKLDNSIGKMIHITREGEPAPGNPFIGNANALPEIWSYGHRNAQGAAFADGRVWTVEHGARGGDEVNHPEAGVNYGWPVISYGRHYSGQKIGVGTAKEGMAQPFHYWDPSIAPSGMVIYQGDLFPEWRGDILVGSLKFALISRLDVEGGAVIGEERLPANEYGRIRDLREGPKGAIWFATDETSGAIYRITPAN